MDKKGLLIGIDFGGEYCKVCYFNERHGRVENAEFLHAQQGFLIPSVLCFDEEEQVWLAGEQALAYAQQTGAYIHRDLLTGTLGGKTYEINGESAPYSDLLSVFMGKLVELARTSSGMFPVSFVNVTMRRVDMPAKQALENALSWAGIEKEKVHLLNYPESFAYFILQQEEDLKKNGAFLFDFSRDGLFAQRLTLSGKGDKNIIFVNERNLSMEFSVKDLENVVLRPRLDEKLEGICEEMYGTDENANVYFTGEGFEELWFTGTLKNISQKARAFRGNNIYAKGACLEGLFRKEGATDRFSVICRPKTRCCICVDTRYKGQAETMILARAAVNWYEAASETDFILDESRTINFKIVSLLSREETNICFDLSSFPQRPPRTTRVRVSVRYINEYECEICVRDMGLGTLFPSSGAMVKKVLDLEGYI